MRKGQKEAKVEVLQGLSSIASENISMKSFVLFPLPWGKKGQVLVTISLEVSEENILTVKARCEANGLQKTLEIQDYKEMEDMPALIEDHAKKLGPKAAVENFKEALEEATKALKVLDAAAEKVVSAKKADAKKRAAKWRGMIKTLTDFPPSTLEESDETCGEIRTITAQAKELTNQLIKA
jgi:molecular chaperone DnaK (HSP70)